jgi:hypothetical protein
MQRTRLFIGVSVVVWMAVAPAAQVRLARRAAGSGVSLKMHTDQNSNTMISTATFTFSGNPSDSTFSVDFVTQLPAEGQPAVRPHAVDMIVSEHPATEDAPTMSIRLDGEELPIRPRFHSSRSMVTTLSFDDFVRLANAATVAPTAFDTQLEFSAAQIRILRTFAEQWMTRR